MQTEGAKKVVQSREVEEHIEVMCEIVKDMDKEMELEDKQKLFCAE